MANEGQISEYSEVGALEAFVHLVTTYSLKCGVLEKSWYEYFRKSVSAGMDRWLFTGTITRRSWLFFEEEVFSVRVRLGWQEGSEIFRLLYWTSEWKEDARYDFAALQQKIAEAMEMMASNLGKDGVVLEPSPLQFVTARFGELLEPKHKPNGSGHHIKGFAEAVKLPS